MRKQGNANWGRRTLVLALSATLAMQGFGVGGTRALAEELEGAGEDVTPVECPADGQAEGAPADGRDGEAPEVDASVGVAPADERQDAAGEPEGGAPKTDEVSALQIQGEGKADPKLEPITFINQDGDEETIEGEKVKDLSGSKSGWLPLETGWYCFTKSVTLDGRAQVKGDVKIILFDGAKVTWNGGINVSAGNSLTIYAQSTGDNAGALTADRSATDDEAGIGGNKKQDAGRIAICGGTVTAYGGNDAAGIGGGNGFVRSSDNVGGGGGTIDIYRGTVRATGKSKGAGIGGGYCGTGGNISVFGGDVKGTGGTDSGTDSHGAAGIGSGCSAYVDNNMTDDGDVNYYGRDEICYGGQIRLFGGIVHGEGGFGGAGIGGGKHASSGWIWIRNCTVIADGGKLAAGIGAGYIGRKCYTEIIDSNVTADGWGGAGIGTGYKGGDICKVTIRGGHVRAYGHKTSCSYTFWCDDGGAGIGGGYDRDGKEVKIEDGAVVEATSDNSAAIGRGESGKDHGSIQLYDDAKVVSEKTAETGLRSEFCKWRKRVVISPCEHKDMAVKQEGDGHVCCCKHCKHRVSEAHSIDESGNCTKCGAKGLVPVFGGTDLVVARQLGLRFWLSVPDACGLKRDEASVTLSVGGKQHREVRLALSEAEAAQDGSLGFTMPLSPLELAEPVTATLEWDGDSAVAKSCTAVESAQSCDAARLTHAQDIVECGRSMQRYLSAANGWKLGKDYAEIVSPWEHAVNVDAAAKSLKAYRMEAPAKTSGIESVNMSVVFGPKASVNIYLKPRVSGTIRSATACWGEEYIPMKTLSDGRCLVRIEGISPEDFGNTIEIQGVCGHAPFSLETSVLTYANLQMQKSDKDDVRIAMAGLYRYYLAARKSAETNV